MKTLGLIMEVNPLHNGHIYFINKAKELVKPDVTIAVISTNFTMRGDISVINKFDKTRLLLNSGVDIVLELPYLGAVASSDYFTYNAVKTLVDFGITDLAFGAECESLETLKELQKLNNALIDSSIVKENLKKGYSYSTSTFKAIKTMTSDQKLIEEFALPNNTLAIGYLNALDKLGKDINVTLVKRIENNYYDKEAKSTISSATSIRELLKMKKDINDYTPYPTNFIDLNESENNLYKLFQYKMLTTPVEKIQNFLGVSEGIENRLLSFINLENYDKFIQNVESKRYTKTYIRRLVLHILLDITKEPQYHDYLRILGFSHEKEKYISGLPKEIKKRIITSPKNSTDILLQKELQATKLYGIITSSSLLYLEEYKLPIIKGDENA